MKTKILKKNYDQTERTIKQLERMERTSWILFSLVGLGYIIATALLYFF